VALAQLRLQFIKMSETNDELKELQKQFYGIAKFPLVIGAIDCTYIKIQSTGESHCMMPIISYSIYYLQWCRSPCLLFMYGNCHTYKHLAGGGSIGE